jgi:hypothetical protein
MGVNLPSVDVENFDGSPKVLVAVSADLNTQLTHQKTLLFLMELMEFLTLEASVF